MMDKHGDDWSAMARDPKNHYQETPAKLRGMVTKFISIPEHYAVYCKERGLIQASDKPEVEAADDDEEEGRMRKWRGTRMMKNCSQTLNTRKENCDAAPVQKAFLTHEHSLRSTYHDILASLIFQRWPPVRRRPGS